MSFLTVDSKVPDPVPTPAPTPVPTIPDNIEVWPGGRTLVQDTTNLDSAGRPDKIRPMDYVQWTIGANDHGFNWPRYTLMVSYTNEKPGARSEHAADTVRIDKRGNATTFARVTEANDFTGVGGIVMHEEDARVMAEVPDNLAQDNGNRFVRDVIVAGSNAVNDPVREVGWTAYLRLRAGNMLAYFSFGFILGAIRDTGVQVTSWVKGGVRAFEALGTWAVGLDFSQAHFKGDAIRLAPGQKITFEPTGCRSLIYKEYTGDGKGDRLQWLVNGLPVFEIDAAGHGYANGKQVF